MKPHFPAIRPLERTGHDYDALLQLVGDARFVLLGEASHGTQEFYAERAEITRCLIEEKGFCAVAVEADWPGASRVHRHYFRARLAQQFDAVLHFDATSALEALEPESRPSAEPRETFPSGV